MTVRRRRLTTTPLLVASAGAAMMLASCEATSSGNLVAPAEAELCVDVLPEAAMANVRFNDVPVEAEDGCARVYEGTVEVRAEADGYRPYIETHEVFGDTRLEVTLEPEAGEQ